MPELPEVETVRRGVAPALAGRRIVAAEAFRPDLRWPLPERFAERLIGRRVESVGRRSKYLLMALDSGETWLVHLGMSGRIAVSAKAAPSRKPSQIGRFAHAVAVGDGGAGGLGAHDHVVVETDAARLVYTDPRRFGAMDLFETGSPHRLLATLGPEPLGPDFSAEHLRKAFAGKTASVKAALLDQRLVAGLGNIYVNEALWRAGVDPRRAAGGLSRPRLRALADAVRAVLEAAIAAGGSSLRDHRQADGALGYFQHAFAVYGRAGEPCGHCGSTIESVRQSARSSFYCPRCQR